MSVAGWAFLLAVSVSLALVAAVFTVVAVTSSVIPTFVVAGLLITIDGILLAVRSRAAMRHPELRSGVDGGPTGERREGAGPQVAPSRRRMGDQKLPVI